MPEPLLYLQSLGVATLASALVVLALAGRRHNRLQAACLCGFTLGMIAGGWMLRWRLLWPPASGLDRAITIILPSAICLQVLTGLTQIRPFGTRMLRTLFIAAAPAVLLRGSVYVSETAPAHSIVFAVGLLAVCSLLVATLWLPLDWLSERSTAGLSIAVTLAVTILSAGAAIMLGGYLKGGAATFAFAGSLIGVALAARWISPKLPPCVVTLGVVQLSCVVGIGYFFGRLPIASALGLQLAPLLCCVSEIPAIRRRPAWMIGAVRLVLVSIVLLVIVAAAKSNFDRTMAPLLSFRGHPVSKVTWTWPNRQIR